MLRLTFLIAVALAIHYVESASLHKSDPRHYRHGRHGRHGHHGGFGFEGHGRHHPYPRPNPYPEIIPGFKCKCTAEYNIVIFGRRVGAYCANWIRDGGKYCYLAGGMHARSCPGARKSRRGHFYHSEHPSVCNACPPICKMHCENGFEKDANGCDVCKCKQAALIGRKRESDVFVNIGSEAKMWHVGRHGNIDGGEASNSDKIDVSIGGGIKGVTSGNGTVKKAIHLSVPPQGDQVQDKENIDEVKSDVFINIGSQPKMWHVGRHENLELGNGTKKTVGKVGVDISGRIKAITEKIGKGIHVGNKVKKTKGNPGLPSMPPSQ